MSGRVPRWLVALSITAVGALVLGVLGVRSLLHAIDAGKLTRSLADARLFVNAIEDYRRDRGSYPVGFHPEQLRAALEPDYVRVAPTISMSYYSDGESYALILRPMTPANHSGATRRDDIGPIEVRNGEFVTWPDLIPVASIRLAETEFRRMHDTPAQPQLHSQP